MSVISNNSLAGSSGQGGAGGGYEIERSLRFNSSDSANLSRTPSSSSIRNKYTWSGWVKRCQLGSTTHYLFFAKDGTNIDFLAFEADSIMWYNALSGGVTSTDKFRDPSAWYHVVFSVDSTQATSADRVKIYVNNRQITSFSSSLFPSQNRDFAINHHVAHSIGTYDNSIYSSNFYLADINFIDGQALSATDFGEYDANNVWQPKKYGGTYGTNGFHLDFSDISSNAALGTDSSGNSNTWTVNNLNTVPTGTPTATATGGLPIRNTTDNYSKVIGTGLRTDANASSLILAAPLTTAGSNNLTDDEMPTGRTSSAKTLTATATITPDTSVYRLYGNAASFSDTGYYSLNDSEFNFGTADFTIECWVYLIDSGSLFSTSGNSSNSTTLNCRIYATGVLDVYTSGSNEYMTFTGAVTPNQWDHIAISRSGSTMRVFVNGTLLGTNNNWSADLSDSGNFYINTGRDGDGARKIQDFRIYKGLAKYTSDFTVSTQVTPAQAALTDALRDTPVNGDSANDTGAGGEITGNYCTWNPLDRTSANLAMSNGNLDIACDNNNNQSALASFKMTSGKWYWEATHGTLSTYTQASIGINDSHTFANGFTYYSDNGNKNSSTSYGSSFHTEGTVVGIAFDSDVGTLTFYRNGVSQGVAFTVDTSRKYRPFYHAAGASPFSFNFGQRPFAYTAPSGYKALCTANLADPTIADGSTAFDTKLWTGNTSVSTNITGYNFSPDFVWIKNRSGTEENIVFDTIRGAAQYLYTSSTIAENDGGANTLTAFNSDGFTLYDPGGWQVNKTGDTYVGWAWDGGSSNTAIGAGSLTSLFYNTNQTWSTYGTFDNHYGGSYTWPNVFNTTLVNNGTGSIYVNSSTADKWTLTSTIPVQSKIKFYTYGYTTVTINHGLSDELTVNSPGNTYHYHEFNFSGDLASFSIVPTTIGGSTGTIYFMGIWIDGKQLVNTAPNVPAIASTVRANPSAGFSIVKWISTAWAGSAENRQVGHSLNDAPSFIITKGMEQAAGWYCYHKDLDATNPNDYYLTLNTNNAVSTLADSFGPNIPDSTTFGDRMVGWSAGQEVIAYCFAPVEGYSAFGKYTGNSTEVFNYLGFSPRLILIKCSSNSGNWTIWDTERSPYNAMKKYLYPSLTNTENDSGTRSVNAMSNGFTVVGDLADLNNNGYTYIWAAFAEHPFKTTRAR